MRRDTRLVPWHLKGCFVRACRKNKHLISPMSTFLARPVMFRSNKVKRFLTPASRNTDQLGFCGVVYKVPVYFSTDADRQMAFIPEVKE